MRRLHRILVVTGGAALPSLVAAAARAQLDVDPPAPDVLLLVDTSGSMERTVAGGEPICVPLGPPPPDAQRSRWTSVVEALTGPVAGFSCLAQPRTKAAFWSEYRLGAVDPYDKNYYLPFHRILSGGCTKGPGPSGVQDHYYTGPGNACPTPFAALAPGLLDTARDHVRFALMTFDTLPDPSTGIADPAGGVKGTWSYFLGFQGGGAHARGSLPGCTPQDQEVGARNPAAPPWEGPLVPFPAFDAQLTEVRATNDRIQEALLAMRPFGATPVAGLMADARDFLLHDDSTWEGKPLGPRSDPCVINGSREMAIVLLSDGEPNLDLRPECEGTAGPGPAGDGCPYEQPYDIAADLLQGADVKTFAVGYSLSTQAGIDCETITAGSFAPGGICDAPSGPVRACCIMARMAIAGGTEHGYFPDSAAELSAALAQIFADVARPTSRTLPVFATASAAAASSAGGAAAVGYQFASSLSPRPGPRWAGNLERKRYACELDNGALAAVLEDIDPEKGDDFAANLAAAGPGERRLFTVVGELDAAAQRIWSERSIRPHLGADDGLGVYGGAATAGGPAPASSFTSAIAGAPRALGLDPASALPSACAELGAATAAACAERVALWEIGEPVPGMAVERTRVGKPLGAIYHATPAVVGAPRDLVPDEAYARFAAEQAARPLVLYAVTTDGQLHAFQVAPGDPADPVQVDQRANNELWSFFPPHVLPRLPPAHGLQVNVLDGAPAVKSVFFQRTVAQALSAGTAAGAAWRTVLVAGGGAGGSFYYALDVTDPTAPEFLWQLSTDSEGRPLFGDATPAPTIATIQLEEGGEVKEVAVAVLAGGAAPLGAGTCPRKDPGASLVPATSPYQPRAAVRCWGDAGAGGAVGPARSVTLVRLDTGAVIRTFRGDAAEAPPGLAARTTIAPFDAPITGAPVAYPSQPGEIADRIVVGDAEGTLWRIDVKSPDPAEWSVRLAWDAYSLPGDSAGAGQPMDTPPIVTLTPLGERLVLFSTGDQQAFTASGAMDTRLWAVAETQAGGALATEGRWYRQFTGGKRVTGPISLFNGVAYFATFTPNPASAAQCNDGFGSIWGLDYLTGAARLPSPNNPAVFVESEDQAPGTVVFGVAVTQTPSCFEESLQGSFFGAVRVLQGVTPPSYQLVYHTGAAGPADEQGAKANTSTLELPPPEGGVSVQSWASLVD